MAQLTVRNLPDALVRRLKIRAARHGRSAEAEHRLILQQALGKAESDFWAEADSLRGRGPRQRYDSRAILRKLRDQR